MTANGSVADPDEDAAFWRAAHREHAEMSEAERAAYVLSSNLNESLDDPDDDVVTAGHEW